MGELTITKENLEKAYKEGCSDVKKVLDNLFPGQCAPKEKWVDVTAELSLRWDNHGEDGYDIHLGAQRAGGVVLFADGTDQILEDGFRVVRNGKLIKIERRET